jgi:hypothetical protein
MESQNQAGAGSPVDDEGRGMRAARLELIDRLERAALEEKDPRKASLGAFNAGLMRMAVRTEEVVELASAELQNPPPGSEATDPEGFLATPRERLRRMLPLLNAHLRLVKQIVRMAEIDARSIPRASNESRRPGEPQSSGQSQLARDRLQATGNLQTAAHRIQQISDRLAIPPDGPETPREDAFMSRAELKQALFANRGHGRSDQRNAKRRK